MCIRDRAKLLSIKRGEDYATTVPLVTRLSLLCHFTFDLTLLNRLNNQETWTVNIQENDLSIENVMDDKM